MRVLKGFYVARYDSAWVSGLTLLLIVGIGGCGARGTPSARGTGRTAGPVTIYVANAGGDTVTPILAASNTAGKPINIRRVPWQIAISPDGQTAYVVGLGGVVPGPTPVTLTAISTATNRPSRMVTVCARDTMADLARIAITPDSRTVYLSCPGTGEVVPVSAGADTDANAIRIASPGLLTMTPDGKTVYAANLGAGVVTPISTATDEPGHPIMVGLAPLDMAITPDGKTLLVLTYTGVTPVDVATNRAGRSVAIEGGVALVVAPGGTTAYVLAKPNPDSEQGFVVPVDIRANTPGQPIKVGMSPQQIAITPDGKMAYVANYASGNVTPIQLAEGRAEPAIAAGKVPARLVISPDGKTVYVLDSNPYGALSSGPPSGASPFGVGQVIPIRVATNSAEKPIKAGRFPVAIAIAS
jgi:DNA-binding beta-propeller fold protein YncE